MGTSSHFSFPLSYWFWRGNQNPVTFVTGGAEVNSTWPVWLCTRSATWFCDSKPALSWLPQRWSLRSLQSFISLEDPRMALQQQPSLAGANASWRPHGSCQVSMLGRSDLCGMGTKELCIDEVPGLLSHDSSWKATYGNFEFADFHLAANHEGSAAVDEFLLPEWADAEGWKVRNH